MATLKQVIYDLQESIHNYTTDSNYSNEYLAYQINAARALLLQQKFSQRSFIISQKLRQHFYAELELAEENEFVDGIGTILRTKNAIEYPLEPFNFKSNIRITSGSYTDITFSLVSPDRFPYVGNSKFIQNIIYVTIGSDFRLYFTSSNPAFKAIENVKLSFVAENPEEAYPASTNYDANQDFWDIEYPLENDMIVQLTDMIFKKLTQIAVIPEDKINDSIDGTQP